MTGDGLIEAYHSSADPNLAPARLLHVGTLDQARMRGGRHMHRLMIRPGVRLPRLRDHGSWSVRTLMRHAARARVAVYLNRHEGIPLEEFDRARAIGDIDRMTDTRFRQLLPSAMDSWIILDPAAVVSIELLS
jgi:hypothetical protein